jgi:AcrR family transcriptional regulator
VGEVVKVPRVEVGRIRREQIVEAAMAIIIEQGIQNLSLSEIENRADMSRGQLTYYFPAKEDILLAVFDRLLQLMHERVEARQQDGSSCRDPGGGWERLRQVLTFLLLQPPVMPGFDALHHTFLSQIAHREDYRQRLADLYEHWRSHLAGAIEPNLTASPSDRSVSPRTVAAFIQALLHGLAIQRAADPDGYDRQEMLNLVLQMLGGYLQTKEPPKRDRGRQSPRSGTE